MEDREAEVLDTFDAGKRVMKQPSGEMPSVKKKLGDTSSKWKELKLRLLDKRNKEETNFRQLVKYASATDELERWVNVTSSNALVTGRIEGNESDDITVVNRQLDQLKVIYS